MRLAAPSLHYITDCAVYYVSDYTKNWSTSSRLPLARGGCLLQTQNKEGILPVATLSIALHVLRRSMSASDVTPEVTILLSVL